MIEASPHAPPSDPLTSEAAWVEVVRKMDETYASLVRQQVELEQKNKELESAHAFIADILGAMTDVLVICDTDQRILNGNRALERAIGRPIASIVGARIADLFVPADAAAVIDHVSRIRSARRTAELDLLLVGADGDFPLSVNVSPLTDSRARVIGAVFVGRPVGELRKAYADLALAHDNLKRVQQRMVHAEKMASLGRLVAGVAHEINNPLSFIYGNSHALRRYGDRLEEYVAAIHAGDLGEADRIRRERRIDALMADLPNLLDGILEGAERTRDIVESLRRYASNQTQSRELVDLVPLIHTATRWVLKGQRPDLPVDFRLPDRYDVVAHSGALQQVFMNLVQNALDAMVGQADARLEIALEETADAVAISVRDHGSGIPEELMTQLFDPFFTTKPVGKGTGLGLSISDKIVGDHGGHLAAANAAGGGAVFTVTLPLAARGGDGQR